MGSVLVVRLDSAGNVSCRSYAAERVIGHQVRFLGRSDQTELPALCRSADVAASVPGYEPFGIVPVEVMACGIPVVAAAVGAHAAAGHALAEALEMRA